ncbi:hypothetical protein [Paenibacillus hexagrammi]|uniref:Lipoprotein n=1 Tax=Paenibacillus hexagrammi TaxID=2908839 RepID=A0ABY3SQC4_9BACL|nr:hypothetical protein [Paenibacillus sp. YPD9-1]UJF35595.1 hypothetical protein L0M14_11135 [Paenibacillus sp. YPD9-1]
MKRLLALLSIVILSGTVAACSKSAQGESQDPGGTPSNAKKMLYVKRGEGTNDPIVMKHFEKIGYTVIDMADNVFKADRVNGFGVVFVSPTVNSSRIDAELKHSTVPIVYAKPQVASITGLTGMLDYGQLDAAKTLQIKDNKHPLAAGLKDQVTVYKNDGKIGYAIPGKEAVTIVTAPGDDKKAAVFAYEKGAKNINNEPVPARQVFFYLSAGEEMNQTDDGLKLLDAAIQWAAQNGK